jgi:chorismate mutase/prephenate dehydratase
MPKRPPSAKTKRKRKPNSAAATADKIASDNDALAALRGKIDAVDEAIQRLIAERAQFAKEVGIVKGLTSTIEYYRPEREAQVLRKVVERNDGPLRDFHLRTVGRDDLDCSLRAHTFVELHRQLVRHEIPATGVAVDHHREDVAYLFGALNG